MTAHSYILPDKLKSPRLNVRVLRQTRLYEQLDKGLERDVTTVVAPAGFGKSVLLADWMARRTLPSAWLPLDANDNHLPTFVRYLALAAGLPDIASIAIGVVGPTAGRFLIDITAGKSAKQFVRGEWFVGTAVLTSLVYLICFKYFGLTQWPATLISFAVGFFFRLAAIWFLWEEPLPHVPDVVKGEVKKRTSLKEKMQPGWEPEYD